MRTFNFWSCFASSWTFILCLLHCRSFNFVSFTKCSMCSARSKWERFLGITLAMHHKMDVVKVQFWFLSWMFNKFCLLPHSTWTFIKLPFHERSTLMNVQHFWPSATFECPRCFALAWTFNSFWKHSTHLNVQQFFQNWLVRKQLVSHTHFWHASP